MAKVLYSAAMSLDGFIAGPGGDMSWLTEHAGTVDPAEADRLLQATGALLVGNRTHRGDDPNKGTDAEGPFGGRYHGAVVVLTHNPPAEPEPGVVYSTDLHEAVELAKKAAGEQYVNVLGADVARQCLAAGLLDEIAMFVVPALLGDGVPVFRHPGGTHVRLEHMPGMAAHWYRVVG